MDKFEAMQRFVLVAQFGSFTKAAEALGLPKSSVSSAVQGLESELGTRLLHRSTRSITLTQDGETYLPQCQALLANLDVLDSQFQREPSDVRGILRVDMPSRFASTVVIPRLAEFIEQFPNIRLKISSADYRVDMIKEGIDCVVRVGNLDDSSLIARPLTQYRSLNCVSPSYAEQFGIPQTIEELANHKLIEYSHSLGNLDAQFEYLEDGKVKQQSMPSSLAVNGTDAYLDACLVGLGIAQIPVIGAESFIEKGLLIPVLDQYEAEPMPVSLLYSSRRQPTKRLTVFMDWLQSITLTK
ncbi:HTH-type transcriptional regulator DmlR [Marinomonas gallaica]|uniref:HTH-type transcriptional regulator DmlR n=1 Tax=Marinomonas gallaica TaxID=1806667 RepID=A0A1C3JU83_9GAMM|nr:LysR family transcriptional regulator [Marinomonas gallaica]SBT18646.1 HTH-type transcriptional regulator DmlR [Marinomonas gallaica]SBT21601.1 HTH-type transcriptional regulator DmlR [Marinomonas gallaica]